MKDNNDWDLFNTAYPKYKCKEIRLIELFGGIGAQCQALEYLHANFKPYRYCEWNYKSCKAYRALHMADDKKDYSIGHTDEEIIDFLAKKGISSDWNMPMTKDKIKRIDMRSAYSDIIATHNLVDIQQVHGEDLGIGNDFTYLMTYSFPCQDLSLAGKRAGMKKGSNTRSGMLWEVERILNECKIKPQVLIMENVPQVITAAGWSEWINALASMGYTNYINQMNAKNYGIPQSRDRCYMVSIMGEYSYQFPKQHPTTKCLKDFEEQNVSDKYYLSEKALKGVVYTGFDSKKLENRVDKKGISPTLASRDYKDPHLEIVGILIKNHTHKGYIEGKDGDGVYVQNMDKKRGCVQKGLIQTLKAHTDVGIVEKVFQLDTGYMENGYVWNENRSAPTLPTCVGGRTQVPKLTQKFQLNGKGFWKMDGRVYDENGIAPTANTCKGSKIAQKIGIINSGEQYYAIRRLTSHEYIRLMGFPDYAYSRFKAVGLSDSTIYHLAGDSIVVQVLMCIFGELLGIDYDYLLDESIEKARGK